MPSTRRLEVGAVVEVEAAHEVLVRLAVAGVLRDDQARHGLEQLAFARDRPRAQVGCADVSLRRTARRADQVVDPPVHLQRVDAEMTRRGVGRRGEIWAARAEPARRAAATRAVPTNILEFFTILRVIRRFGSGVPEWYALPFGGGFTRDTGGVTRGGAVWRDWLMAAFAAPASFHRRAGARTSRGAPYGPSEWRGPPSVRGVARGSTPATVSMLRQRASAVNTKASRRMSPSRPAGVDGAPRPCTLAPASTSCPVCAVGHSPRIVARSPPSGRPSGTRARWAETPCAATARPPPWYPYLRFPAPVPRPHPMTRSRTASRKTPRTHGRPRA